MGGIYLGDDVKPYYEDESVTLYHGDCREVLPFVAADVLITDPPYGITYASGMTGHDGGTALPGISGDEDTSLRDGVLAWWGDRPAIVFGTWKRARPSNTVAVLTWEKGDHVGMGDLLMPWKPNTEEIYVLGRGFSGHRGSSVLRYPALVTWNSTASGREHPHEKPPALMSALIAKAPMGVVFDPFCGSGTTLTAAKRYGRKAIGVELEEHYCEIAARRLSQGALTEMFAEW